MSPNHSSFRNDSELSIRAGRKGGRSTHKHIGGSLVVAYRHAIEIEDVDMEFELDNYARSQGLPEASIRQLTQIALAKEREQEDEENGKDF